MTPEEYKKGLADIEEKASSARKELHIKYAESQRKFEVGDIIEKDGVIILVERFGVYVSGYINPEPKYIGLQLKKDLTPRKDGNVEQIYGNTRTIKIK